MFLRIFSSRSLAALLLVALLFPTVAAIRAQEPAKPGAPPAAPVKPDLDPKAQKENKTPSPKAVPLTRDNITAEQVVEATLMVSGGRETLNQIRRNGLERGKRMLTQSDGKVNEATYERRFKRGDTSEKDQIRVDQVYPVPYSMIYADNEIWAEANGSVFPARAEFLRNFQNQMWHGLEALFRYKEDGSTITLAGREKHAGVDVYVIDLAHTVKMKPDASSTAAEIKLTTRYFISVKLFRVLWLEYDDTTVTGAPTGVKYMRRFYDYKVAQGTFVPYRSVLMRDGTIVEESDISTITYGIKIDDSLFVKSRT